MTELTTAMTLSVSSSVKPSSSNCSSGNSSPDSFRIKFKLSSAKDVGEVSIVALCNESSFSDSFRSTVQISDGNESHNSGISIKMMLVSKDFQRNCMKIAKLKVKLDDLGFPRVGILIKHQPSSL